MPIQVSIDKERRLVLPTVAGSFTLDEIVRALHEAVRHPDFEPGFNVLSDHTRVETPITTEQLKQMMEHLESLSHALGGARWAVVTRRPASHGMMRMFSVFAERVPMEVEVFDSLAEAEGWVGANRD